MTDKFSANTSDGNFHEGEQGMDRTAEVNGWPDIESTIEEDVTQVMVRYISGQVRRKTHINPRLTKNKPKPVPPVHELDLSEGWDTASQAEIVISLLKKLGIYRSNLRFSAFDSCQIGASWSSSKGDDIIFCSTESDLFNGIDGGEQNCLEYALKYDEGAVAVYDGDKLEHIPEEQGFYCYRIKDPSALRAILKLK